MRLSLPGRSPSPAAPTDGPGSAEAAFDLLHKHAAGEITRQLYLLTGDLRAARRCATRGFQLAWQRWAEVARDPDPEGWVRAAACEHAIAPWRRLVPRRRARWRGAAGSEALIGALQALPPARRHAVLLYDGVGLGLPETAAETQASTPATAGRLDRAHAALAASVPELVGPDPYDPGFPRRVGELMREVARAQDVRPISPERVRRSGERYAGRLTLGTAGLVAVLVVGMVAIGLLGVLRPGVLGTGVRTPPAGHPADGPHPAPSPPPAPAAAPPASPSPPRPVPSLPPAPTPPPPVAPATTTRTEGTPSAGIPVGPTASPGETPAAAPAGAGTEEVVPAPTEQPTRTGTARTPAPGRVRPAVCGPAGPESCPAPPTTGPGGAGDERAGSSAVGPVRMSPGAGARPAGGL
jgi:DNA-directed RNA polymerase specialized sigma24 family protein